MPTIAPDTGSELNAAGLQSNPSGLTLANFVATPQSILAGAQAQGQLGQLSDQLALEKAQRQADMASTNYKIAATGYLQNNLATLADSDKQALLASIAGSKSTAQGATNTLATAQAYANSGGPKTAGAIQSQAATNALAGLNADYTSGFASSPGFLQGAITQSGLGAGGLAGSWGQVITPTPPANSAPQTAVPSASIQAGSAPLSSAAATAVSTSQPSGAALQAQTAQPKAPIVIPAGAPSPLAQTATPASIVPAVTGPSGTTVQSINPALTGMMQGIREASYIDATTDPHTLEIPNYPNPGETSTIYQRVSKVDGSVVSQTTPVVTKNDATRLVQRSAQDIVNLQTSNNLIGNVQTSLDKWNQAYTGNTGFASFMKELSQGESAAAATSPNMGKVSLVEKAIGGMAESPETRQLASSIQVYNQSLGKLDPDTQKGASTIGISVGDIVNPDQLQTKLNGAKEYAAARLKTFANDNISQRINPGANPAAPAADTAAAPVAPVTPVPSSPIVFYKGAKGSIQTINGQQYFVPAAQ